MPHDLYCVQRATGTPDFQSFIPLSPAKLSEGWNSHNDPAGLLWEPGSVSPLLCHPYAARLPGSLSDDQHLAKSRSEITSVSFQKLQIP